MSPSAEHRTGHDVDGTVDATGREVPDVGDHRAPAPVDHVTGPGVAHRGRLRGTAHRDHARAAGHGQLHRRQPHPAGRTGHEDRVPFAHPAPLEHPEGGSVGDRQGAELRVGQRRAVDPVGRLGGNDAVLREAAVTLAAEDVGDEGVVTGAVVEGRVEENPRPRHPSIDTVAQPHDRPCDVTALDAREVERPPPAARFVAAVGALAGPQVGVVAPAAVTRTRTSPGPGRGASTSRSSRTSGPPWRS